MSEEFRGIKVLVIDDSRTIRKTAQSIMKKVGCEVVTAENGFDALVKIVDYQPDIIFVDIMMPRLDGYQTCALVKHHQEYKNIPVIMLSSKNGVFDRAKGTMVGAEHYVTKPFSRDDLLEALQTHAIKNFTKTAVNS